MNRRSSASRDPDLPDALRKPDAWPERPAEVGLVETHISWVFLVGPRAYKVKKPVRLDFLDFSTRELRRHFCEEELRINRRFAPELYLGLSRVVEAGDGLAIDRPGNVVDYAVRMQRFDHAEELDALLARDAVSPALMYDFGVRLAGQHEAAPVAEVGHRWADPARTLRACEDNFDALRRLAPVAQAARVARLEQWTRDTFAAIEPALRRRLGAGRFRECHGDLHCANVVRHGRELWAFDALEFDPGLRWIDVASDLAFLYMDLRARDRGLLASALLDGWLTTSGDFDALAVLLFYEAYRAAVRAKVDAIRHDQSGGDEALGREIARYLTAAERATSPAPPRLVVTTGLSGSGKSWLARQLLAPLDAVRIRSDVERKRRAGLAPQQPSGGRIYTAAMTRETYRHLERLAESSLRAGFSVVVDAACLLAAERTRFRQLAGRLGVPYRLLAVSAELPVVEARLDMRASGGSDPSEATRTVLARQTTFAEPPGDEELADVVRVDTSGPVDLASTVEALLDSDPVRSAAHG